MQIPNGLAFVIFARVSIFNSKLFLAYRYVGHLKERSLKDQLAKDPTEVIRKAVMRMLPRNKLRDDRDRKLRIFAGNEHPFGDRPVEPYVMPPRQVRELRPRVRRAMIRAQKKAEQQKLGATYTRKSKKKEEDKAEEVSA
ncbi:50S ribosomal protein [Actinidia chinensis var. chinensis]|uniref:50S ribosomal protein n=1 Tax=Actinidia chinensis var. chinensis TaxID=1590841 RepID=A0A2R6RZ22_ACTCC|nr:50S ribosomal protein [Actinidia chinensis var. chinensis]